MRRAAIHGENMVLLDGETFTEISKMLHFKNKKRNMIDKISVEMLVRDNQIEIFPFVIEMDRYRAAVSGVQKLRYEFRLPYFGAQITDPVPARDRYLRQSGINLNSASAGTLQEAVERAEPRSN